MIDKNTRRPYLAATATTRAKGRGLMNKILTTVLAIVMGVSLIACAEDEENPADSGNGNGNSGTINGSFTVESVDGLSNGRIPVGGSATLNIRLANNSGLNVKGITNGLRVYSPDGAGWGGVSADTTGAIGGENFDLIWIISEFSVNGSGADTIGFAGSVMTNPVGMAAGFNDIVYTLTIGPVPAGNAGKTVCVDSSYYPPSGVWLWAGEDQVSGKPAWSGPHCYPIGQAKVDEAKDTETAE